tara:strand:- start:4924 stop:5118 length:195 start_codon:yes stop_codon:yes gene_type:complete
MKKALEKIMKILEDIDERLKKLEMIKEWKRPYEEVPRKKRCPCCGKVIEKKPYSPYKIHDKVIW